MKKNRIIKITKASFVFIGALIGIALDALGTILEASGKTNSSDNQTSVQTSSPIGLGLRGIGGYYDDE